MEKPLLPVVGVIILNWNRRADLLRCVSSVLASDYPCLEIVVVDNASSDGSVEALQDQHPDITTLRQAGNLGYSAGNNIALRYYLQRRADFLLLVNNDAVVEPSTISTLVNAAQAHPEAGFIGPLLMTLENPHIILTAGGILVNGWRPVQRGIGENDTGQMDTCPEIDYLAGYVLLVRREVVEKAGPLDEEFFMYYEDTEWCARARRRGFSLYLVPQAKAYHPDTRGRDELNPLVTYYMVRNSLLFAAKNGAGLTAYASILSTWVRNWLSWTLRPRWKHKAPHRQALQFGLRDALTRRYGQASPAVKQALLARPD